MHTLIIGLGNPILGDDGVGWRVAEEVSRQTGIPLGDSLLPSEPPNSQNSVSIERYALAGLSLMERLENFQRVILIDSLNTGKYPQGQVVSFTLNELEDLTHGHSASAHDVSLKLALKMGREMNIALPDDSNVHVIAIEAKHVYDFKEELTPAIAASVPKAVECVLRLLENI